MLPGVQISEANLHPIYPLRENTVEEAIKIIKHDINPYLKSRYEQYRAFKANIYMYVAWLVSTKGYIDYELSFKFKGNGYIDVYLLLIEAYPYQQEEINVRVRIPNYRLDGYDLLKKVLRK